MVPQIPKSHSYVKNPIFENIFLERCNAQHKQNSRQYVRIINPYIFDKAMCSIYCFSLNGNDVANDPKIVSNAFIGNFP